jgi:hypothetical protein
VRALAGRLARLEERTKAGDCPVCRGEPPWGVRYEQDGVLGPPSREPCPGCGGLNVIEVEYAVATPFGVGGG